MSQSCRGLAEDDSRYSSPQHRPTSNLGRCDRLLPYSSIGSHASHDGAPHERRPGYDDRLAARQIHEYVPEVAPRTAFRRVSVAF
ncbi:hypothetical protein D0865_02245 [Hortaea werneckii]|uniref:Uncharacterized protein n=1 Tax=Hortaea werneckii TaxID=91943 RepID=A0A3M7D4A9_HORWE|nr:hypothetical protein D0865_02245 [Hortaea werneckii]